MTWPPACAGVVAFAGTVKLIAASTSPGAAIRVLLAHIICQSLIGSARLRMPYGLNPPTDRCWHRAALVQIALGTLVRIALRRLSKAAMYSETQTLPFNVAKPSSNLRPMLRVLFILWFGGFVQELLGLDLVLNLRFALWLDPGIEPRFAPWLKVQARCGRL